MIVRPFLIDIPPWFKLEFSITCRDQNLTPRACISIPSSTVLWGLICRNWQTKKRNPKTMMWR